MRHKSRLSAFTLVELSIVLVILGLLVGGVLSGQSLIRTAELRAITTEHDQYLTAVHTFKDKYFALPGDMTNATAFWHSNSNYCDDGSGTATVTGACNGDGDGLIDLTGGDPFNGAIPPTNHCPHLPCVVPPGGPDNINEFFGFWNQLALAGLITGNYSGISGDNGTTDAVPGSNVPASKMRSAAWGAAYFGPYIGDGDNYALDYGHAFIIGAVNSGDWALNPDLKPEEAWNIDTKMDDGKPGTGRVIAKYWSNACSTGGASETDVSNSTYNLGNGTVQCALYFVQQF